MVEHLANKKGRCAAGVALVIEINALKKIKTGEVEKEAINQSIIVSTTKNALARKP